MRTLFFLGFAIAAAALLLPARASACACCAQQGGYQSSTKKVDQEIVEELEKFEFKSANLYTDPGYPDTVRGIAPLSDKYTVTATLTGDVWTFNFKNTQLKVGTLELVKPASMVEYMVDQEPDSKRASSVTLYKEWRFKYQVKNATGFFQSGMGPKTDYFLVFLGRGNSCSSASDFKYWRLEVTGQKASYAFFGKVAAREAKETKDTKDTKGTNETKGNQPG